MNTFVGRNSGQCISTGANNTGFGYRALAAGRGPIGLSGLIENHYPVTTSNMTAFGASCLELSRGNANTGLGMNAGKNLKSGSLNVTLGFGEGGNLDADLSENGKRSEERRVGKEWVRTCRSRW